MDLHNVRESLNQVLKAKGLSRHAFANKHGIGPSWLDKVCQGQIENPGFNSVKRLAEAIQSESEAS